jgi:hypothetical protein
VAHRFIRGRRPSGAIEISGRRHEDAAVFGELAHDCGAVGGRTDPDRNIQTPADEIDQPVIEFQRNRVAWPTPDSARPRAGCMAFAIHAAQPLASF